MLKPTTLLLWHLLGWSIYGMFEHISHVIYDENHWVGSFFGAVAGCVLTTLLAMGYARQSINKSSFVKLIGLFLLTYCAAIIWHNLSRVLHYRDTFSQLYDGGIFAIFSGASYAVLLFFVWLGFYLGGGFYLQKQQQYKHAIKFRAQAKEAQLQSLRYQLNPHYLFNVLNSIDVAVLEHDNDAAHSMLLKLSRLLRVTLQDDCAHKVTVRDEVSLLDDFISIEQQRYVHKIEVIKCIEAQVMDCLLPSLILQPLVENAIKFTWQVKVQRVISLSIKKKASELVIVITNPINTASSTLSGTKTGLKNVQSRIDNIYLGQAKLTVYSEGNLFTTKLILPVQEGSDDISMLGS